MISHAPQPLDEAFLDTNSMVFFSAKWIKAMMMAGTNIKIRESAQRMTLSHFEEWWWRAAK
jgi:hypothetical protein